MLTKKLENVSLNELISLADYSIEETTVPTYDEIIEQFSDTWADIYLDEELKEKEGQHCFIIWDDCNENIRAIVVSEELDKKTKMSIVDIMDNVIFDLIYPDIIERVTREGYSFLFNSNYEDLLNYIDTNAQAMEDISNYEYSWLQVLVNDRFDLVTL